MNYVVTESKGSTWNGIGECYSSIRAIIYVRVVGCDFIKSFAIFGSVVKPLINTSN
jgi:hypothetical protein